MKSQMRRADKLGARYALVVGEAELESGQAELKDLRQKGEGPTVALDTLAEHLRRTLEET